MLAVAASARRRAASFANNQKSASMAVEGLIHARALTDVLAKGTNLGEGSPWGPRIYVPLADVPLNDAGHSIQQKHLDSASV